MRIRDWSSDVCSSDLLEFRLHSVDDLLIGMQARYPFGQPLDGVAPNFRERCNVIGKFMRGCRKERSPAGRPDHNAGHAEWSLHPHAQDRKRVVPGKSVQELVKMGAPTY